MKETFVHLNVKSCFSILNSIVKIPDYLKELKNQGQRYVAISDINVMHAVYDFQKLSKKNGLQQILGVTFLVASKYLENEYFCLTLLAKNVKGYKNLVALSTNANTNQKEFPFIKYSDLVNNASGLFCLTGGEAGEIFALETSRRKNGRQEALDLLMSLKNIFKENLYLEVCNHGIQKEKNFLERGFIDEALNLGIEPVATNNVYYIKKEHSIYRSLAVSMNPAITNLKAGKIDWVHKYAARYVDYNSEFYLKTEKEMKKMFNKYITKYPMLFSNTVKIAEQCKGYVPTEKTLPEFPVPEGYTAKEYLHKLAWQGFEERYPEDSLLIPGKTREEYKQRLEYEYNIICQMGFVDYHLIVQDFINFAKDKNVYQHPEIYFPKNIFQDYEKIDRNLLEKDFSVLVGPGRGSAAGSLLCYCLKITDIDPIKHNLLFERFLNPERVSMPDIDIDFPNAYRYLIVQYVQNKYGFDKVSQIATFITLGVKSIIKNLGKALNIPYTTTDELSKKVPSVVQEVDRNGDLKEVEVKTLKQLIHIPYFQEQINKNEDVKELFNLGLEIFDELPSTTSKHAAGVIIGCKALQNYLPLMDVDGVLVGQFEKNNSEEIGLLKMDFLGLQTLDLEDLAVKMIKQYHNISVDLDTIPEDDEKTFALLQGGQTTKVFQLESEGMKRLLVRMKPTNIEHINAIVALYRPGPMDFIDDYLKGKSTPETVDYPHETYKAVSEDSYGILVYQEQIMRFAMEFAGFSMGEADTLRKAAAKKKVELMNELGIKFIDGAMKKWQVTEEFAKAMWKRIQPFAKYGFNKSHSAAYARIAYVNAYLKANYPECFMAACATINADNKQQLLTTLMEIKSMKIDILPPAIGKAKAHFMVEKTKHDNPAIRYGYMGVDGIGKEMALHIEKIKIAKTYLNLLKGCVDNKISKKAITSLIYAGGLDIYGDRKAMVDKIEPYWETLQERKILERIYDIRRLDTYINQRECKEYLGEYDLCQKVILEQNVINIAISGHPISYVRAIRKEFLELQTLMEVQKRDSEDVVYLLGIISNIRKIKTKSQKEMAFINFSDETSNIDGVIFPKNYENTAHILEEGVPMLITGKIQIENENGISTKKVIVNSMEKALKEKIRIYLNQFPTKDVKKDLLKNKGIVQVCVVDSLHRKIETQEYFVNLQKAKEILCKHHIAFIISAI